MAIAEVGSGSQRATATTLNGGGSHTVAYPANVTSGNLLVVCGAYWQTVAPTSVTVTDSLSTSYTVVLGTVWDGNWRPFIAYGIAPSSGANTVTIDPQGTSLYGSSAIDEFSGVDTGSPVDATNQVATGSSTTPAVSITTATADALLIGCVTGGIVAAGGLTPGASYTQIGELEDSAGTWDFNAVFRLATTATSYSVDWTKATSAGWSAITIAFKASGGGGGGAVIPIFMNQYRQRRA